MRCAGRILYMCPNAVGSNVGATFGGSRLRATEDEGSRRCHSSHFTSVRPTPLPLSLSHLSRSLRQVCAYAGSSLYTFLQVHRPTTAHASRATPLLSRLHSTSAQTTLLSPSTDCIQARIVVTHGGSRKRRQGASATENRSQVVCSIPYLVLTPESC